MGASLGVMQFPWSQSFDRAHMHPGRLVNEFDLLGWWSAFSSVFMFDLLLLNLLFPAEELRGVCFLI